MKRALLSCGTTWNSLINRWQKSFFSDGQNFSKVNKNYKPTDPRILNELPAQETCRKTLRHIIKKLLKTVIKRKILKAKGKKRHISTQKNKENKRLLVGNNANQNIVRQYFKVLKQKKRSTLNYMPN